MNYRWPVKYVNIREQLDGNMCQGCSKTVIGITYTNEEWVGVGEKK